MLDSIACIYCGGKTHVEIESNCGRYKTQRRRCDVCRMPFEVSIGKDCGAVCTVEECPERASCLLKREAQKCAVYRSIVMRGNSVSR